MNWTRQIVVIGAVFVVCRGAVAGATPQDLEHFEKRIRPLFVQHCNGCHGNDPKKIKGGLKMTSRAELLRGGDTGPAIMPGRPEHSLMMEAVEYHGELKMPPKGKLRADEIAAIEKWIRAGAPWPSDETEPATPSASPGGSLFTEEQRRFWAFQPLQSRELPIVRRSAWVQSPIDAFILAKLETAGLEPAPPASKSELLRRVTFDLIGLPPSMEELNDFLADNSPTALEKVIDRLLASPDYGERWGRHWLDVARYGDSNGLDENTAYANAWRYRDYVIRSFNANKPFDQFIQEQMAGDLLPKTADAALLKERLTALGYLALGPKLLAEPDKQKMVLDIADEQLDTIGKGLLGLTLGCARCHDHKFDPIPTRDYYSLLGILTSTRTMDNLTTVAKTFERKYSSDRPGDAEKRQRLEAARKEVRKLEAEFGQTPAEDQDKRHQIHLKAEEQRAIIKKLEAELPPIEHILGVEEGSQSSYNTTPRNLFVQVRGNYLTPSEEAPPVFPRIFSGNKPTEFVSLRSAPASSGGPNQIRYGHHRQASGRLEFSLWLTDPKRNPLTPRVIVNRIWLKHFGHGIVRSPDNFGKLGEAPTHPELLDFLASQFITSGWNVKAMHKLIMLSSAYQMSAKYNPSAAQSDPDNKLLWRYPPRRLEAEAIRDAMLVLGGNLDRTMGGSLLTTANFEYIGDVSYDAPRRSVYLPVIRGKLFPFFQMFDFPDPTGMSGQRSNTVVASQALYLMNSPFVAEQAKRLAERLLQSGADDAERLQQLYLLAYSRQPQREELQKAVRFLERYGQSLAEQGEKEPKQQHRLAWRALVHAVLGSSEFLQAH